MARQQRKAVRETSFEEPQGDAPTSSPWMPITVKMLVLPDDDCPFEEWYAGIRDKATRARIRARIIQLKRGLDNRHLGGVAELKLDFGPGYRIYYARQGDTLVILIAGGDKLSQSKDIERARALWEGYKNDPERFRRDFPE